MRKNAHSRAYVLKEDLVYNDYSIFAEEFIWKSQIAEEFIKSFQFSLVTTLSRFRVSQLKVKQKSSRISLINSLLPELWKINTSATDSVFIFHNSDHSEFICHLSNQIEAQRTEIWQVVILSRSKWPICLVLQLCISNYTERS